MTDRPWSMPRGIKRHPLPAESRLTPPKQPRGRAPRPRPAPKAGKATLDPSVLFLEALKARQLPNPHREHRFHDSRQWRFDYAWPAWNLALEVDGGIWVKGRHTRGAGWLKDTEKLNTAASMGWRLLRCTPQQLCTDEFLGTLRAALDWFPK